jgi:hypothetical protein
MYLNFILIAIFPNLFFILFYITPKVTISGSQVMSLGQEVGAAEIRINRHIHLYQFHLFLQVIVICIDGIEFFIQH